MSNDLISRSALLEEINNFSMRVTGSANTMALVIMDETKKSIMRMVEEQPDVYDVDKVVEQLEEMREEMLMDTAYDNDTVNHYLGYADLMTEAVKSGGIE